MIKYITEEETVKRQYFEKFICDKCKRELTADDIDLQESYTIQFEGGYSSMFGDSVKVTCDLCQDCLFKMIGEICKYE